MKTDHIIEDQISIDVSRSFEENESMITICIYDQGIMIDAYNSCSCDLYDERKTAYKILRRLDIDAAVIMDVMKEDYFDEL